MADVVIRGQRAGSTSGQAFAGVGTAGKAEKFSAGGDDGESGSGTVVASSPPRLSSSDVGGKGES